MACDICKAGGSLYLVKKVHMCEDCYQKLMSLRYKSQEGFAWAQGILTDEFMDETVKNMLHETIKEYRADAPTIPTVELEETKTCFEKKSKVAQVLKKVRLFIIENF